MIAASSALSAIAQAPVADSVSTMHHRRKFAADSLLGRWVLDVNLLGGAFTQNYTTKNTDANYLNGLNLNTGKLKFTNGYSVGGDAQIGVFFGNKRHWGIGTGFMYLSQAGDATLDHYHVEYQATDVHGQVYRQLVTGDNIKEKLQLTNMNIPLVLKYKNRFSHTLGFTADAGLLFNVQTRNAYNSNAAFDYEAIYKYEGNTAVYDNAATPDANDVLYTKAKLSQTISAGNLSSYFATLHGQGLNVGLGVKPNSNTGSVSYTNMSVGFLLQPSLNVFLSDAVALNFGLYYMFQPYTANAKNGYQLTNKVGDYSSSLNTVTATTNQSYGLNIGVRFFISHPRDKDHDGIYDKDDDCPLDSGLVIFNGCPDRDGDMIRDIDDSCPTVPGLLKFHGCPDSDNDGIPDKDDACPYAPGPEKYHGCPDRDGDGIIDKDDLCPDKFGLAQFHGCPDTDGDGVPDNEDKCPDVPGPASNQGCPVLAPPPPAAPQITVSTPILFQVNKTVIREDSHPILELAAAKMKEDKSAIIVVNGYTDATGRPAYNKALSLRRANAVKKELVDMGVSAKRIKVVAHGEKDPAETNDTPEGRAMNRRAVMHLNVGE